MNRTTKFNICLLLLLLAVGCRKEDDLYPTSRTEVDSQTAFATADRIEAMVQGMYNSLKHGQFYGGRYIIYNEVRAENFINQTQNSVTGFLTWGHNVTNASNEVQNLWSRAYIAINNANLFLDGMTAGGLEVVGEQLGTEYMAEARFVRALSYYCLLQLYARPYWDGNGGAPGLPIRLVGNDGAADYSLVRSSVGEVYSQIIEDLTFAENNLPESYASSLLNTTRAHKNTAIALKTRAYLSMGDYSSVVEEGNKIVSATAPFSAPSGVGNALVDNIEDVFAEPYTTAESVFSMPMGPNSQPGTQNALQFYYVGNVEFSLNPAGIVGNAEWQENDARRSFIGSSDNRPILTKWTVPNPWTDFVPVIRYAEVLLNLSEAIARNTNSVDARAVSLLNAVRNRSDATVTYTTAGFANAEALIDAILTERNIELLGEGFRSPDLLRLGRPLPAKGTIGAVNSDQQQYIWPIAANELLYNSLMTDN